MKSFVQLYVAHTDEPIPEKKEQFISLERQRRRW